MGIIRPATPGFLVTLLAAGLLAVVTFSVPYFKTVYFLRASLQNEGESGSVIFGTLGYCLELSNGTTCSKPSVGYSFDINALVGNSTPLKIPNVVVKWITYALVLHVVALVFAAVSAVFGLLAHVREFSMTCCSTCLSGGGAAVALLAFIFDLALFFVAKSRINAVKGGSATIGIGIWLTLAAWLLLFFAGCFYGLGRCCISRRPRDRLRDAPEVDNAYAERMRMDAVRAEADRKARQAAGKGEAGLPAFAETQPLTSTKLDHEDYVDDGDQIMPYNPALHGSKPPGPGVGAGTAAYARQGASPPATQYSAGGYVRAAPGTRAVDDYYNAPRPGQQPQTAYPPQQGPRRQASAHTVASSQYSGTSYGANNNSNAAPPPMPTIPAGSQYLSAGAPYGGHSQYPSAASQQQEYGHLERGTSYHSAATHQQYPSAYSAQYPEPADGGFASEAYNHSGYTPPQQHTSPTQALYNAASTPYAPTSTPYAPASTPYAPASTPYSPEHGYAQRQPQTDAAAYATQHSASSYIPSPYSPAPSPSPDVPPARQPSVGPSQQQQPQQHYEQPMYEDSPPVYDAATAMPTGMWNTKR